MALHYIIALYKTVRSSLIPIDDYFGETKFSKIDLSIVIGEKRSPMVDSDWFFV